MYSNLGDLFVGGAFVGESQRRHSFTEGDERIVIRGEGPRWLHNLVTHVYCSRIREVVDLVSTRTGGADTIISLQTLHSTFIYMYKEHVCVMYHLRVGNIYCDLQKKTANTYT